MKRTFCSYFNHEICRSCEKIETPYQTQLLEKSEHLIRLLGEDIRSKILATVASSEVEFRNKAKFSVTGTLEEPIIGLTGELDLDRGREILNCPIHHPLINQVVNGLKEFIQQAHLIPYQIKSKSGELKGIIIYYSPESDEMYVRFVLRSKEALDRIKKFHSQWISNFPFITCLSANIQPIAHALLEGEEEIFFTKNNFITHQLDSIQMSLHPQGFVQTNQNVAKNLYTTAANWAKELKIRNFLELFSGQGAFSFFIQSQVENALGVEINQDAVLRANETARALGLKHLNFISSDATIIKKDLLSFMPDLLLVNPPRRGLSEATKLILDLSPPYLMYSSCDAKTLAIDLEKLSHKYEIYKIQIFDMFPHTSHFETLVLLKIIEGDKT
jgi:23S rRNA (uracil747-C5)-methyltransferase